MTMKKTFTYEELNAVLEKALEKAVFHINENEPEIAQSMDKAWNRGATSMFNHALIEMYRAMGVE